MLSKLCQHICDAAAGGIETRKQQCDDIVNSHGTVSTKLVTQAGQGARTLRAAYGLHNALRKLMPERAKEHMQVGAGTPWA